MTTAEICFDKKVVRALKAKGVKLLGVTSMPTESGSFLGAIRVYEVSDNDTFKIWTWNEVMAAAKKAA